MEISRSAYNALSEELDLIAVTLKEALESLEAARDKGDISENSEFDSAKLEVDRLQKRRLEVQTLLQTAKVINTTSTTKIIPGTLIELRVQGIDDPSYERDLGLLMFDNVGNTVLNGKITPDAPVGQAIKDGRSGTYEIIGADSKRYRIIVQIASADRLSEFLLKYPTDTASVIKEKFLKSEVN